MLVLDSTTVASTARLQETIPAGWETFKALLFPSGEQAPFIVEIPRPPASLRGTAIAGLEYMPWLTGDAAAGPTNHSYLEIAVTVEQGVQEYMTVAMVDQDHPPHIVHPKNMCIEMLVGGGIHWTGNVLAVRRVGGQLVDVQVEHIGRIADSVAYLIRAETLAARSALFVAAEDEVHTDSE
ncbi:hypothetical protein B0H15DRAFT_954033 [Mycena belliarum]|uniref:Uncharacterized protein n=1 Tax=Mycena belliarum TaxID=1033014 RepID=A0AAD6TZB8_9AGAR|nr:hypothetical protein B0H15DRAFT_954033 [Mycena belliae]